MKRKLITTLLIIIVVLLMAVPSSFAASDSSQVSVNAKSVCYTAAGDYRSGDCILTATKVMIRRASVLRGSTKWSSITNKTLRKSATIYGLLLHKFKFEADGLSYKVQVGFFKGTTNAARVKEFEKLIKEHPEGVVVWGKNASVFGMHGVLLTNVKNGVPYVMDSYYNLGTRKYGIQAWEESSMKNPVLCTQYWIIKEVGLAKKATAPDKGKPLAPASAKDVSTKSTLAIRDKTVPSKITEGNSFGLAGVISSNYRISKAVVSVADSSGNLVICKTVKPGVWNYDLANIDSSIKFGTLNAGTYTYRVVAKDEKQTKVLVNSEFTVSPRPVSGASNLKITSAVKPTALYKGEGFSIGGKITSDYKISKVTVSVINDSGKAVLNVSAKPNAKSYDISKLDSKVTFGVLSTGTYTYSIVAKDAKQTKKLVSKSFEVVDKPVYSTLKIESYNYPESLSKGKSFSIKGLVRSNKKIKTVTVQVVDSDGNAVLSASANPNAKSYSVKNLDVQIKFGSLKKGTYRYQVKATDTLKTKTLVNKEFKVI